MKQKTTKLFLAALVLLAGVNLNTSAELTQVDGVYQIGTAEDLIAFSALINAGTTAENTQSAVITAPIDMKDWNETFNPIGKTNSAFAGNFDGRLQPITNLNKVLFGTINGAQITGIAIASGEITMSATTYAAHCGSIVGTDNGNSSVIANSYSLANVTNTITKSSDTGGLVGKLRGTLKNCYFAGAVSGKSGSTGALVGSTTNNTVASKVLNCYSLATSVKGGNRQGALVGWLHAIVVEENCCAIAGVGTFPNGYTTDGAPVSNCESLTAEQFASGMAAYLLNEGETTSPIFRQTIGTDSQPVFDTSHGIVYQTSPENCDGTPKGEAIYSNSAGGTRDPHNFVDGFCSKCSEIDVDYAAKDGEGYYKISTPTEWFWFTELVNGGTTPDAKARLQNEISLAGIEQKPIGTPIFPFTGTFDGQLKPITGVSTMLFGTIDGATITGVALAGGNIAMDATTYAAHFGGIVGVDKNTATVISDCYSLVNISSSVKSDVGGLVGKLAGTLKNSFFKGSVTATNGSTGALVGSTTSSDIVSNVLNCFSYASSVTASTGKTGALVGWLHKLVNQDNCYAIAGVGAFPNGVTTNGAPVSNCEQLTAEQFASGEAAYKLGEAFFQTIGTDTYPAFSGEKVYKTNNVGWATFYDNATNYAFVGVKAYTGKVNGESLTLTEVSQANAGTPVILEGTYYNKVVKATTAEMPANDLVAATTDLAADGTQYVLAVKDDVVGFYQAVDGTIAAGKAYLTGIAAGVKALTFGTATSIVSPLGETEEGATVYDLSGRRVEKATKGIYIVNGKKILK